MLDVWGAGQVLVSTGVAPGGFRSFGAEITFQRIPMTQFRLGQQPMHSTPFSVREELIHEFKSDFQHFADFQVLNHKTQKEQLALNNKSRI